MLDTIYDDGWYGLRLKVRSFIVDGGYDQWKSFSTASLAYEAFNIPNRQPFLTLHGINRLHSRLPYCDLYSWHAEEVAAVDERVF